MLFNRLPVKLKSPELKKLFMNCVDQKAYEFIAKKVSNSSGDIRVAFDLMKSGLSTYAEEIKKNPVEDARLTVQWMVEIHAEKTSSKVAQILQKLPRQDLIVLSAAVVLFEEREEEGATLHVLFQETEMECDVRGQPKIEMR